MTHTNQKFMDVYSEWLNKAHENNEELFTYHCVTCGFKLQAHCHDARLQQTSGCRIICPSCLTYYQLRYVPLAHNQLVCFTSEVATNRKPS